MEDLVWFYIRKVRDDYKKFNKYADILVDTVIDDIQSEDDLKNFFIFLLCINGYDGKLVEEWVSAFAYDGQARFEDGEGNTIFSSEDEGECIDYILQQGKLN